MNRSQTARIGHRDFCKQKSLGLVQYRNLRSKYKTLYPEVIWKFSSAGRASALQAEGHRFEPCNFHWEQFFDDSDCSYIFRNSLSAGVAELADARDLKSRDSNIVPVQFRSPAVIGCRGSHVSWGLRHFYYVFSMQRNG